MPIAQECLDDGRKLLEENREREKSLPQWRWRKRQNLNSEWLRIADYIAWMMRIIEEDHASVKPQPSATTEMIE